MEYKDITDQMPFGKDINFEWVLNVHLNRIAGCIHNIDFDAAPFARNVDMLEFLLQRELPSDYKERWKGKKWPNTNGGVAQRGYTKMSELMIVMKEVLPPAKAPRSRFASK